MLSGLVHSVITILMDDVDVHVARLLLAPADQADDDDHGNCATDSTTNGRTQALRTLEGATVIVLVVDLAVHFR